MEQITPTLKLHTRQEKGGTHINSLIMTHKGNSYHLFAGAKDTVHVFSESIALYVLTVNKAEGTLGLNAYMAPEPFPINTFILHSSKDIKRTLGSQWEKLSPETLIQNLTKHLI
ncbi:hypothetical protein [Geotalea sp. SG265]|uniref:hypothetical protein n=1 Tax=Geotalea sp. SG265 TaxID=2922867 RepID=UPI001FAE7BE6|nr:hypothetical protein [Geotalea sp. SG265]